MKRDGDIVGKRNRPLVLAWVGLLSLAGCSPLGPLAALQPEPVARGVSERGVSERGVSEPASQLILIHEETVTVPLNSTGPWHPIQRPFFTSQPQARDKVEAIPVVPRTVDQPMRQPTDQFMVQPLIQPEVQALPISLDTVLRLAQDQNGKVALAREKVNEAYAAKDLADKRWLPDLFLGPAYYRHDGGIQDFTGNLINSNYGSLFAGVELRGLLNLQEAAYKKIEAERNVWEKEGELSRLSSEKLLEASNAYVAYLAALSGEALAVQLEKELLNLLDKTEKLAKINKGFQVEEARIQTAVHGHRQRMRQMRGNAKTAAAQLAYLLSLDPSAELVPIDRRLIPFTLVSDTVPLPALVEEALISGPGVREMEGLLNLIDEAQRKSRGLGQLMPVLQMNVAEGGFGAGPGASAAWANRFDLALQARWNLSELATVRERRRLADSRIQQAQLSYQELRGKLTVGVQEAQESSISRKEQFALGEQQIKHAQEVYELSKSRWTFNVTGASPSEVLQAIQALGEAQFKCLEAIREHNHAQLNLFVLTGRVDPAGNGNCPASSAGPGPILPVSPVGP